MMNPLYMEDTVWASMPIEGFEKNYLISQCGSIWSVKKNLFLTTNLNDGCVDRPAEYHYVRAHLYAGSKRKHIRVHRAVALAFVPNPDPDRFSEVDHIDRDKLNNHYSNLRWVDRLTNMQNIERNPA